MGSFPVVGVTVDCWIGGTLPFGISAGSWPEFGSAGAIVGTASSQLACMVVNVLSAFGTTVADGLIGFPGTLMRIAGVVWGSVEVEVSAFGRTWESLRTGFVRNWLSSIRGSNLGIRTSAIYISGTIDTSANGTGSGWGCSVLVCVSLVYKALGWKRLTCSHVKTVL